MDLAPWLERTSTARERIALVLSELPDESESWFLLQEFRLRGTSDDDVVASLLEHGGDNLTASVLDRFEARITALVQHPKFLQLEALGQQKQKTKAKRCRMQEQPRYRSQLQSPLKKKATPRRFKSFWQKLALPPTQDVRP